MKYIAKVYMNDLKTLWNRFDPIGVYRAGSSWPDDEYEVYIQHMLSLLDQGAGYKELSEYIRHIVNDHMEIDQDEAAISAFVYIVLDWYKKQN